MTLFYLGLQDEQVGGTDDVSRDWMGGSLSRVIELEELLAEVTEEIKQVFANLN